MIDLAALDTAVFDRLASDAAGADVRAVLGSLDRSVITAEELRQYEGQVTRLPAVPLLALRRGPAPISDRVLWLPSYNWYAYDDETVTVARLRALPALIAAAYVSFEIEAIGVISVEVSTLTPIPDRVLGLVAQPIALLFGAF
jgi:hypothetical protein